jgi:hypothetical protein
MIRMGRNLAIYITLLLLTAATATAELYRCIGPDGGLVFTDDESTCPGASAHESPGALQTHRAEAPPSDTAAPPARPRRPIVARTDERTAMKNHWQSQKRAKENELRVLQERSEYLSRFVAGCNRGSDIISRDETGIKRTVSCDKIRAEYEQSLERQQPIRDYLDGGLQRECRQAGCLPGWIR